MKIPGSSAFVALCNSSSDFFSSSEEDDADAMDVDSDPKPKRNADDLTEYNLDEYDNDVKTAGTFRLSSMQSFLTPSSRRSLQQH
jgi:hypothetical protein